MKKILLSSGLIVFVAAMAMASTGAFFSDSETSTGNILAAGAIDLGIDNHSYYNGVEQNGQNGTATTTWRIDYDIDNTEYPGDNLATAEVENGYSLPLPRQFFNFRDLKPGDWGEDTISLHVKDNDSWLCADVTLRSDDDNDINEPESDDGDLGPAGVGNGDLANALNFFWWADDGDNVLEVGENLLPAGPLGALDVDQTATVALADSQTNLWNPQGGPLPGDQVRYIGKAWCFGDTTMTPYTQDGLAGQPNNGPDARPVLCDGSAVNNLAQTDSVTLDIGFRAVQSRHNSRFQCVPQTAPETATVTVDKVVTFTQATVVGVDVNDFTLHISGPGGDQVVVDEAATSGLAVGAYTVSEVYSNDPVGIQFNASFSGSCTEIADTGVANMTVVAGVNPTCVITNLVVTP